MDRKSIIVLVSCFVLLVLWSSVIVPKLYPPKPLPPGATNSIVTTLPGGALNSPATLSALPAGAAITPAVPPIIVNTNVVEELLVLTNEDARYTFTSYGGGLKLIELVGFPETVSSRREKRLGSSRFATLNAQAPAPMFAVLDGNGAQGDGIFNLTATATGVRAEKTLSNGLALIKEFVPGTNYLVTATVRLENRSTNTLSLPAQEWIAGTATPMSSQDNGQMTVGMMWYNGEKAADILGASYFSPRGFACTPRVPPLEFRGGQSNVVWTAAHNQFFALVAMPQQPAEQVVLRKINLPRPDAEDVQRNSRVVREPEGYVASLVYPAASLVPGQTIERQIVLYAGPKEYRTLSRIAAQFNNNVDSVMNFGWFGFFSKALLLGMNWLHSTLRLSYGWAIIAITVIIKIIFWPLTQASTRSMKRMQELGPQMKELQAKYKDSPQKLSQKQWEFWKKNKVNPMGGCLPMMVQIPVFFGLYGMIRTAIELRGAQFLWITDLSQPDTLGTIPGTTIPFNLLPLIYIASALWQSHLTPVSPGMDPAQQKLMRWMPLMFLAILYNFSSGLALYMTVQNLLTIVQTKLIKTQTAAATATPVPVLTPPPKKRK